MTKVIRFTASWCGPCKQYAPVFDAWSETQDDKTMLTVDVDEHPEMVKEYGISTVPTTVVEREGSVKIRAGAMKLSDLDEFVNG